MLKFNMQLWNILRSLQSVFKLEIISLNCNSHEESKPQDCEINKEDHHNKKEDYHNKKEDHQHKETNQQ